MLRFETEHFRWRIGSVSMWREYFDLAGTALAVINGLIAITIALLPMRRSVLKLRLGAVALVLGALAVGATFYSKYRAYVQSSGSSPTAPRFACGSRTSSRKGATLLGQIRAPIANCRRPPRTSGRNGRKSFFATSSASAPSPGSARTPTSSMARANVAAPRLAYWRAVRNRVVNLEAIGAEFAEQPGRRQ